MPEYIERDTVLARIKGLQSADPSQIGKKQFADGFFAGLDEAEVVLIGAVFADVVPVVRCKDCKHLKKSLHRKGETTCPMWGAVGLNPWGFCNLGKRKDGAT